MDFHLLGDVRQYDGDTLGELRHVAYDANTREVLSLVTKLSGLEGRTVIIPMAAVASADDDATYVHLSLDQVDRLPSFAYGQNIAPPPSADNMAVDEFTDPVNIPDVPPIGAATGVESIAFTPVIEVTTNLPPNALVIDAETMVTATDGDLGRVQHVLADDQTHVIVSVILEEGIIFQHSVEVPAEWVAEWTPAQLTLTVARAAAEAAGHE